MENKDDFFDLSRPQARRSFAFLAAGALIGLGIAGYSLFTAKGTRGHNVPAEDVALVNGRQVLRSDFLTQTQTQFNVPFEQATAEQRQQVLKDMVNEELLMQRGLDMDLPSYDPDVRAALVAGVELEVTADVLAQQPSDEELQAYYKAHQDRYVGEGMMRLRDLLLPTATAQGDDALAKARAAVAALRGGMTPDQAIEKFGLQDSGRFLDGGKVDTGDIFEFAAKAKLGDKLYATAGPLKSGEVSDPAVADEGVHIFVMLDHRMPKPMSYDEAKDRVWTELKTDRQNKVKENNLKYLRSKADILITPEYRAGYEQATAQATAKTTGQGTGQGTGK
ncbi:MAG: peptidyl-prolyl cis-trans isomerase [Steroidobacteraceae bacterium]